MQSVRDQLQARADRCIEAIHNLEDFISSRNYSNVETETMKGNVHEWKGRIYALRDVQRILGIELNTGYFR